MTVRAVRNMVHPSFSEWAECTRPASRPGGAVQQLSVDRGEEAFRRGVVVAGARSSSRLRVWPAGSGCGCSPQLIPGSCDGCRCSPAAVRTGASQVRRSGIGPASWGADLTAAVVAAERRAFRRATARTGPSTTRDHGPADGSCRWPCASTTRRRLPHGPGLASADSCRGGCR